MKSVQSPLLLGLGAVALVSVTVAVTATLLAVGGRPRETDSARQGADDLKGVLPNLRGESPKPPNSPNPGPPAEPKAKGGTPAPVPQVGAPDEPAIIAGAHDKPFKDMSPDAGLLIGLEIGVLNPSPDDMIKAVRPIYRVGAEERFGAQWGARLDRVTTLKAKPGYAVGAMTYKRGAYFDGCSLTFMAVKPGGTLDPADSYESEWAGWNGAKPTGKLGGDGRPVIGIVGRTMRADVTGLGLLFRGQEGWDPGAPAPPSKLGPQEVVLGSKNGTLFRDVAPPGGLLVGFDIWYGTFGNYDVIDGIRPLYRTDGKETLGEFHGRDTKRVIRVSAKPDYAVGAVTMRAGEGPDSMVITFMRIKGDRLDPGDSYRSEKCGGPGGDPHPPLGGDGTPVIGVIGCLEPNSKLCGFGLAFPKK